jgi:hypothetical protein
MARRSLPFSTILIRSASISSNFAFRLGFAAEVFSSGQGFIELGNGRLKLPFKLAQFLRNDARMRPPEPTDFHACSLEPALSAKRAHIPPINLQTLQEAAVRVSCKVQCRSFALGRILGDLFE